MTNLRSKPSYDHIYEPHILPSSLDAHNASEAYKKLSLVLAMHTYAHAPAAGWPYPKPKMWRRSLFKPNGFHHPVRWMPKLEDGWRRLRYDEFCAFYNLKPFDEPAKKP